mmetsp:Transcript_2036/g.5382  ORF Transcript_2036/g.5382 Transcript_2036/m.5382 type:complete len:380 (+) Transcript_2036:688-1827(+)
MRPGTSIDVFDRRKNVLPSMLVPGPIDPILRSVVLCSLPPLPLRNASPDSIEQSLRPPCLLWLFSASRIYHRVNPCLGLASLSPRSPKRESEGSHRPGVPSDSGIAGIVVVVIRTGGSPLVVVVVAVVVAVLLLAGGRREGVLGLDEVRHVPDGFLQLLLGDVEKVPRLLDSPDATEGELFGFFSFQQFQRLLAVVHVSFLLPVHVQDGSVLPVLVEADAVPFSALVGVVDPVPVHVHHVAHPEETRFLVPVKGVEGFSVEGVDRKDPRRHEEEHGRDEGDGSQVPRHVGLQPRGPSEDEHVRVAEHLLDRTRSHGRILPAFGKNVEEDHLVGLEEGSVVRIVVLGFVLELLGPSASRLDGPIVKDADELGIGVGRDLA